jgi:hypothetical protein
MVYFAMILAMFACPGVYGHGFFHFTTSFYFPNISYYRIGQTHPLWSLCGNRNLHTHLGYTFLFHIHNISLFLLLAFRAWGISRISILVIRLSPPFSSCSALATACAQMGGFV